MCKFNKGSILLWKLQKTIDERTIVNFCKVTNRWVYETSKMWTISINFLHSEICQYPKSCRALTAYQMNFRLSIDMAGLLWKYTSFPVAPQKTCGRNCDRRATGTVTGPRQKIISIKKIFFSSETTSLMLSRPFGSSN